MMYTVRGSPVDKEQEFYQMKGITEKIMLSFTDPLFVLGMVSETIAAFPIIRGKCERVVGLYQEVFSFLDGIIDEHLKQNDYSEEFEPRDYIDAFLLEMNRCEDKGETHYFSKAQLRNNLIDLWMAGQETTSETITWGISYLICYPETQEKLHAELDNVIGSDRMITVSDRTQLPYTQAVIMETQRVCNLLSGNLLRRTTRDIDINGVRILKGTAMIPQISTVMADPNTFENTREFNPSRFIDANGQFQPREDVIPFSVGRRSCLGESLARMELFLFIANVLNQYKFSAGKVPPTMRRIKRGVAMGTEPYTCRVERRFQ